MYNAKMDTVFMNCKNSKTWDCHWLILNLRDEIKLKRTHKFVALSNLSIHHTWKNLKKSYKNNKFKISAPTWNEQFEFPNIQDIQDCFE